ncbi:MAG: DUF3857 domain-containing protein [Spirochaetales bacterium]|nr:DUF3857 domain-containing protein [Spirochaetales bacterium]
MIRTKFLPVFISALFLMAACAGSPPTETGKPAAAPAAEGPCWITDFFNAAPDTLHRDAAELDFHPDEEVRLFYTSGEFTYDEQGRLTTVYRTVYEVMTEQGKEGWSDISFGWNPWFQKKPLIRVRVTNPDGSVHYLEEAHMVESAARENNGKIFSDAKVIRAPLPNVIIGSIVEQEIIREESAPYFAEGSLVSWYFRTGNSIKNSTVRIKVPENLPFQYKLYLMDKLKPVIEKADGVVSYGFSLEDLTPDEDMEERIPADEYHWEAIRFTTAESWQNIAAAYAHEVDSRLAGFDFSPLFSGIDLEGLSAHEAAVQLLRGLNAKVRYTGMELGEKSIIPAGPQETLNRGYGDCKDKALVLTGMLRQAGYRASVALLNVNRTEDTDPELPGMGWFDHAIVHVDEEGGFWIDATSEMGRDAYLPNPDRERFALVISENTGGLVKTPSKVADENIYSQERTVRLADSKQGQIEEKISYAGALEIFMRNVNFNSGPEQRAENWQKYIDEEYNGGELKDFEMSPVNDLDTQFTISFTTEKAKCTYTEDYLAQLALFPATLLGWVPDLLLSEQKEERTHDFSLNFPYVIRRDYRIYPPRGFVPYMLPENEEYELGSMSAERQVSLEDDHVLVSYRFSTGKALLTPAEFAQTGKALRDFRKRDAVFINFLHEGQMLLEEGDYKAALEKFQELIELGPDNAMHRLRYARALLKAGFASSAKNAINEAIQLNPESGAFYAELGWILQHDDISRRFYPGYAREQAIEAYKKAIEYEPDNWEYCGNLAILYEYDRNGLRYSDRDASLTAAEYYRKARELKEDALLYNLLINYFYTGEYVKMKDLLDQVEDEHSRNVYGLLYETGQNGIEAAVAFAEKNISREDRRKAYKDSINQLVQDRNYEAAVRFLREAAKGSSEAVSLEQRADYLAQMKKWESLEFTNNNYEDTVRMFYKSLILSSDLKFADLEKVCDPRFFAYAIDDSSRQSLRNEYYSVIREAKNGGLRMANILDSMLCGFRMDVKAKDSGVAMIKMQPMNGSDAVATFFVIRNGSSCQVISLKGYSAAVGKVIVDSWKAGNKKLAEDLLDLFHDEYYKLEDPKDPFFSLLPYEHFYLAKDLNDRVLYAGASLMGEGIFRDEAITILEKGLASAGDKAPFYYALYYKYLDAKKLSEFSLCGEKLAGLLPESEEGFIRYVRSRPSVYSPDTIEREAREWMSDNSESAELYKVVLHKYADHQRFTEADRIFSEMNTKNFVGANEYNNHAWMGLFRPKLTDEDFSNARKAVSMTNSKADYILHTMAALYAEIGRCQEARTMLDQEIHMSGRAELDSNEWYVLGRIAEEYGIMDFALDAYARVEPPDVPEFDMQSCYALTKKRLDIINMQ